MPNGRFVSKSIGKDMALNGLSIEAELLYLKAIPHLDRDGLINGDDVVFLGTVAPRRLAHYLDKLEAIIDDWINAGLVTVYHSTQHGRIFFFRGFRKNQQGLKYGREAASEFPAPPDYVRMDNGLTPDKDTTTGNFNPDLLLTNSGVSPLQVQVQGKGKVQGKGEGEASPPAATTADATADKIPEWEQTEASQEANISNAIKAWEGLGLMLNKFTADEIKNAVSEWEGLGHPEYVVQAIEEAGHYNKRNWSYVSGILRNCRAEGRAPGANRNNGAKKSEPFNGYKPEPGRYDASGDNMLDFAAMMENEEDRLL